MKSRVKPCIESTSNWVSKILCQTVATSVSNPSQVDTLRRGTNLRILSIRRSLRFSYDALLSASVGV